MFGVVLLAILAVLVASLLLYSRKRHQYWQNLGVYSPPTVPLFGNFLSIFSTKEFFWDYMNKVYKKTKDDKIFGFYEFFSPTVSINNLELVQKILIKDFDHFVDRRHVDMTGTDGEVMADMLTNATGSHWKGIRSVLSPTFASGKIKTMFHMVQEKSENLFDYCEKNKDAENVIDLSIAFKRFTMDVIATCAFGLETNALRGENMEFMEHTDNAFKVSLMSIAKSMLLVVCKPLFILLRLKLNSPSMEYFVNVVKSTIEKRKSGTRRNDFVGLMLDARESEKNEGKQSSYTLEESTIVAQSILFLFAGYDTTANTLRFVSHMLANNTVCQDTLRDELKELLEQNEDGKLSYTDVMNANYLDSVVAETLRLHPSAPVLERLCTKDYK